MEQLVSELKKMLNDQRDFYAGLIVGGESVNSMERYRELVGKVAAMNEASEIVDVALSNVLKAR